MSLSFLVKHDNSIKLGINKSVTTRSSFVKRQKAFYHKQWIQKYNKRRNGTCPQSSQHIGTSIGFTVCVLYSLVRDNFQ